MPRKIRCSRCGAVSPRRGFAGRMAWLRRHLKRKHPVLFRRMIEKAARTRRRRK